MTSLDGLPKKFTEMFAGDPRIFRAPGRVNLIGEHVDYNEGLVLPIAIDRDCFVCARPRSDRRLRIHSEQMRETIECGLDDPRPGQHHWSNYVRGVAWALAETGRDIGGADLLISNDVAMGAGISSSAALEVSCGLAFLGIANAEMEPVALAQACQRAEDEFVGMHCGIMDQLAACCGRRGHAMLIDCRTREIDMEPLDESEVSVVVANTMGRHALAASSEYNRRRKECDEAVERIRAERPDVRALRDVYWEDIERMAREWPQSIRRRARHVTTEIERVRVAAQALRKRDFAALGRLITQSHKSLDEDYEVSSAELNLMVKLAGELPGFLGGRMTGAGFGGCTVNLVQTNAAADFANALAKSYKDRSGILPDVYMCHASSGAAEIT
ncbi:MAG TPA: galactokinase [Candidatus Acidoferrales bacterium]|nr:galactokinase [Candidatus Acidoferrales bacterium]